MPVPAGQTQQDVKLGKISGSSLIGVGVFDGDYLAYTTLFDPNPQPGRIYAIRLLTTGVSHAKKIVKRGKHMWTLQSASEDVADMHVNPEDVEILGMAYFHGRLWPQGIPELSWP